MNTISRIVCRTVHKTLVAGVILSALLIQGCMIHRFQDLRAQFCDTEKHFALVGDDGLQVSLLNPVIRDTDVRYMVGISPYEEIYGEEKLTIRYIVQKENAPDADDYSVPIEFGFQQMDGHYKLSHIDMQTHMPVEIDQDRFDRMSASACDQKPGLFQRRVSMQLGPEDMAQRPTRNEVFQYAGLPSRSNSDDTQLEYEFSILGTPEDSEKMLIKLKFDDSGNELLKMESSFLRYTMNADFENGQAFGEFSI